MTSCSSVTWQTAGMAFDTIAEQYDDIFTRSLIGRAQRDRSVGCSSKDLPAG